MIETHLIECIQYKLGLSVDGRLGKMTKKAIQDFQKSHNLKPDGVPGPLTCAELFGVGYKKFTPLGVVIHAMSELFEWEGKIIPASEFLSKIGLSVHGLVHTDGIYQQLLPYTQPAHHAGKSTYKGLKGLNKYFIGIEMLVPGVNTYEMFLGKIDKENWANSFQYNTLVTHCRALAVTYNLNSKDFVRHSDVSGDNVRGLGKGKKDPGSAFSWEKFTLDLSTSYV